MELDLRDPLSFADDPVFRLSPLCQAFLDGEHRVVLVNPALEHRLSMRREALRGRTLTSLVHAKSETALSEALDELADGAPSVQLPLILTGRRGRLVSLSVTLIERGQGSIHLLGTETSDAASDAPVVGLHIDPVSLMVRDAEPAYAAWVGASLGSVIAHPADPSAVVASLAEGRVVQVRWHRGGTALCAGRVDNGVLRLNVVEGSDGASSARILATINHEIRSPLNAVIGLAHLIEASDLSSEHRGYLAMIQQSARQIVSVVNDVVGEGEVAGGGAVEFDIHRELSGALAPCRAEAESRGLVFGFATEPTVPQWVFADVGRIGRAARMLATHAIERTATGQVDVSIGWLFADSSIRIVVEDTGAPTEVSESDLAALDPAHPMYGLAICQDLVRRLGGRFQSEPATKGNRWSIELPVEEVHKTPVLPEPRVAAPPPVTDEGPRGRVLVAEDNPVSQKLMQGLLLSLGYRCDVVGNGEAVLAALERQSYQAVLMDCRMPGVDGFQATRRLRSIEASHGLAHTYIIAVTAHALRGDRERCIEAGMDDYISKPVGLADLRRALQDSSKALTTAQTQSDEVLDTERIAMLKDLGPGVFDQLIAVYLDRFDDSLSAVRHALRQGAVEELKRAAHSLRGASANVGASGIAGWCRSVETRAAAITPREVGPLLAQLDAIANLTRRSLRRDANLDPA